MAQSQVGGYQVADRVQRVEGSVIRELLKLTSARRDLISFAGGFPAADLFDETGLRTATAEALQRYPQAWQYGTTEGLPALRDAVTRIMEERGVLMQPDELVITTGSMQGIDLIAKVMLDPGDVVIIEHPAFLNAIQCFTSYGGTLIGVDVDADGMNIEHLEATLRTTRPKMLYLVATFSNPSEQRCPSHAVDGC